MAQQKAIDTKFDLDRVRKQLAELQATDRQLEVEFGRAVSQARRSERDRIQESAQRVLDGQPLEIEDVQNEALSAKLAGIRSKRRVLAESIAVLQRIVTHHDMAQAFKQNEPAFEAAVSALADLASKMAVAAEAQRRASIAADAAMEVHRMVEGASNEPDRPRPSYATWRLTPALTWRGDFIDDGFNASRFQNWVEELKAADIPGLDLVKPFTPAPWNSRETLRTKAGAPDSSGRDVRVAADFR
jgi:hypothetical protein